jgi:ABC-2 type transport system ATP-binding protein
LTLFSIKHYKNGQETIFICEKTLVITMSEAILLDRVSKNLGKRQVLNDISFAVQRSDIFGYLGPNGAGKTTTIRIILGLFKVDSGQGYILGDTLGQDDLRRRIGFVLEVDGLYDNLNARENLDFYCQLYKIAESQRAERIEEMLHLVGLQDRAGERISTYSKGMRQKLALARAMVHTPELLVLDEPTAGVDPSGQMEVRSIILNLAKEKNTTIFLSSHNLDEVQRICNRIALIDRGQIKVYGELTELTKGVKQQELVIETGAKESETLKQAVEELLKLSYVISCHQETSGIHVNLTGKVEVSEIVAILSKRGIPVEEIKRIGFSLEEIYAQAVRETER